MCQMMRRSSRLQKVHPARGSSGAECAEGGRGNRILSQQAHGLHGDSWGINLFPGLTVQSGNLTVSMLLSLACNLLAVVVGVAFVDVAVGLIFVNFSYHHHRYHDCMKR